MNVLTPLRLYVAIALLELACVFVGQWRGQGFLIGDCPYYAATAESLYRDGDWDLRNQLPGELKEHDRFYALSKDNRVVPKHSVLMPIVSMPFYIILGTNGFLVFNLVQTFLLIVGIVKLAGGGVGARWLGLIGFLTTPFLIFTYNFSPDVFGAVLVVWSFHFAQRRRSILASSSSETKQGCFVYGAQSCRLALSGFLAGLAVWTKIYLAIVLLPLALFILPMGWKRTLLAGLSALLALLPMLIINAHLFGAPWITGYDREAHTTETGFAVAEHYSRFNQPIVQGLCNLLFDPRLGMLRTAPLWFLWPIGVWFALRSDRSRQGRLRVIALTLAILVNIGFFVCYDEWNASSYGNRFLFPALAIGLALQGPLWERVCARTPSLAAGKRDL